jgi:hypothetical protein
VSGGIVLEQERPPVPPLPTAGEPGGEPGDVAFVISHTYVDALACFREPIKYLADRGWRVDLYTRLIPTAATPNFQRPNVPLHPLYYSRLGALKLLWQLLLHRPRYRAIFTVPQWSLRVVRLAAAIRGIPVICISDEIIVESELRSADDRARKEQERRDHARCAATIALSPERADFIRQENRLPDEHRFFIVPNSAPGPATRLRSRYYQDVLGIPEEACIVLHAGGLSWPPAARLAEIAASWTDPDVVLVYQGRRRDQVVGRVDHPSVRFNPIVLPADLLDYAVSSATIGLALYPEEKSNDRLMSTASGKLCLYLKNRLPVITTRQACFGWVERSGCGLMVSRPEEVLDAVEEIRRHYETFCAAAARVYDERLDFARNFEPVERALLTGALEGRGARRRG